MHKENLQEAKEDFEKSQARPVVVMVFQALKLLSISVVTVFSLFQPSYLELGYWFLDIRFAFPAAHKIWLDLRE